MDRINASMLHELRMVILHATKLLRRTRGAQQGGLALLCSTCLRIHKRSVRGTINNAVTVVHGNAVCLAHFS